MAEIGWAGMKKSNQFPVASFQINTKFTMRVLFFWLLVTGNWLLNAYACPACSDALERGRGALAAFRLGQGISWSVLFMIFVPWMLIGSFTFVIWKSTRRQKEIAHE